MRRWWALTPTGAMYIHCFHLLALAREPAERGVIQPAQEGHRPFFAQSLVVIVFSALAAEGFINEFGEAAGRLPLPDPVLLNLSACVAQVEATHGPVEEKYRAASVALTGKPFDRGSNPYQDFRDLLELRDALVHPKHRDSTDSAGRTIPESGVLRGLRQRGLTYTQRQRADAPLSTTSWLNELQTPEVAEWAYSAAVRIIMAVAEMVPSPPFSNLDMMIKDPAAALPTISWPS